MEEGTFWNNAQVRNTLFYIMILIVILLCAYLLIQVKKGGVSCMANPFSYQLKQISSTDENKNPVTCSCQCSFLPKGKSFYVTKNTTTIVDSFSNFKSPELNLTKITI